MSILVTGFKPFLSEKLNPSELLAQDLSKYFSGDVVSVVLPVEFKKSYEVLSGYLSSDEFDYVIMLGQAAGRDKVCLEKIALNWVQSEYPDETGVIPPIAEISSSHPLALMSSFPVDHIYEELHRKALPISISFSAGTYVCNELYFQVSANHPVKSVFIHVPLVKEQIQDNKPRPYMEYAQQLDILKQIINVLLSER